MERITRDTYPNPFGGDDDVRIYTSDETHMASVTTILDTRDTDKSGLKSWQARNDGTGDNADHTHLFWYSRQIGTLGHWHALSTLEELEWSEDEAESAWVLHNVDTITDDSKYTAYSERLGREFTVDGSNHEEIWDASPREVLYSVSKRQHAVEQWGSFYNTHSPYESHAYYNNELLNKADRDVGFFTTQQTQLFDQLGITTDSVVAVEQFLFNPEYNYAGQVDLVYEDPNGYIVVADLKSSSGCYDKHQLQGAAYAKAVEMADDVSVDSVDRLEVLRTHPRSGQVVAHTHDGATGQQPIHSTEYWYSGFDELWNEFESLTDNFAEVDFEALVNES